MREGGGRGGGVKEKNKNKINKKLKSKRRTKTETQRNSKRKETVTREEGDAQKNRYKRKMKTDLFLVRAHPLSPPASSHYHLHDRPLVTRELGRHTATGGSQVPPTLPNTNMTLLTL